MADSKPQTRQAYARHRKALGLPGGNPVSVEAARKAGRLGAAAVMVDGVPMISDFALADREWERNTDASKRENAAGGLDRAPAPSGDDGPSEFQAAKIRRELANAAMAEIELGKMRGDLIPARDVERRLADIYSQSKTRLLGIPSRARQALPHLTAGDLGVLEALIREALEALADGGPSE